MTCPQTCVVHCRRAPFNVYIGRPSVWANQFRIGPDGNRQEVIAKFEAYLRGSEELLRKVHLLRGKRLGCWCAPQPCHGDVLAKYADNPELVQAALADFRKQFREGACDAEKE